MEVKKMNGDTGRTNEDATTSVLTGAANALNTTAKNPIDNSKTDVVMGDDEGGSDKGMFIKNTLYLI